MKKFVSKLLLLLVVVISICLLPVFVLAADKNIIILHTNDIHCGVEDNIGMAALAQYKKELSKNNCVLLVDSGDAIQGTPLGKLSEGEAIIKIMNTVGYDFAVPGNHEFDYSMDRFSQLAEQLSCGYYSANLLDKNTGKTVLPPYKIFDFAGTKLAFIGATTPETLVSSTPAYFQDENGKFRYDFCEGRDGKKLYKQLQQNIDEVKRQGAEYVFLVAHFGLNGTLPYYSSAAVISNTDGLTAVLDGHSHEQVDGIDLLDKKGRVVLLGQTGTKLQSFGQLTLKTDGNIDYKLVKNLEKEDDGVCKLITEEKAAYASLLQEPVGKAMVPLYVNDPATGKRIVRSKECSMGDLVADAYRVVLETDAAIVNGGGIRADFKTGVFNYNDVLQALPFGNMCVAIEVTGQQLLDALEMGAADYPQESGAFFQVSGISYMVDSSVPSSVVKDEKGNFNGVDGPYRVKNVKIGNRPLEIDRKYTLAGSSYILRDGGNGMTMFKGARILQPAAGSETDIFIEYVQNHLDAVIGAEYAEPYGNGRIMLK